MSSRTWCFTAYDDNIDKVVKYIESNPNDLRYAICGREICPTTGKVHGQGYFRWNIVKRASALHKLFPKMHIEKCKGGEAANYNYCSKDNNLLAECGTADLEQGKRTDLEVVRDMIKEHKTDADIYDAKPSAMRLNLDKVRRAYMLPIHRDKVEAIWIYGPAGCGKSTKAHIDNPDAFWVPVPTTTGTVWFDGYAGESTIIFDDFPISAALLKRTCQGFKASFGCKGGHVAARWTKVVFTSNYRPEEVFTDYRDWPAVHRRLTVLEMPPASW